VTWAKVDDRLHRHRKARRARAEAMGVWVMALSYCADNLTDGALDEDELKGLLEGDWRLARRAANRLVEVGLWERTETGFLFHDWPDYQAMRADVLANREKRSEAGRLGGLARSQARAKQSAKQKPSYARAIPIPSRSRPREDQRDLATQDPPDLGVRASLVVEGGPTPEPEQLELVAPEAGNGDLVREVWEHWLAHWRRVIGQPPEPKLTTARRGKIRARLVTDGYTVAQLRTAIDACWASSFHVERRHTGIGLICRDAEMVDKFLARSVPHKAGPHWCQDDTDNYDVIPAVLAEDWDQPYYGPNGGSR